MFDLHVHAAPDIVPRVGDDAQVVDWYREAGFRGCVLKGHYDVTAARARAVDGGTVRVCGSISLNRPVGGFSPIAVATALELGARVVWLPTVDAWTQHAAGLHCPFDGDPVLGRGPEYAAPPVDPRTAEPILSILRLIADADAVLATGHLSAEEVAWILPEARRAGIRRIMLTHPSYTAPAMSAEVARTLASSVAAAVEITAFQLLLQDGWDAARLAGFIRGVGVEHCLLSSDAGNPAMPSPPEALGQLIDALAGQGLDRQRLIAMASDIPEALVLE